VSLGVGQKIKHGNAILFAVNVLTVNRWAWLGSRSCGIARSRCAALATCATLTSAAFRAALGFIACDLSRVETRDGFVDYLIDRDLLLKLSFEVRDLILQFGYLLITLDHLAGDEVSDGVAQNSNAMLAALGDVGKSLLDPR
jgi:hypothetical protein